LLYTTLGMFSFIHVELVVTQMYIGYQMIAKFLEHLAHANVLTGCVECNLGVFITRGIITNLPC